MKLYGFHYSPYVRKVRALLDLLGRPYEYEEVPYSARSDLAALTGGYVYVPVLATDDGEAVCDSRRICEHLLTAERAAQAFVPPPLEGPIWAYHDWCDGPLEDVLFRIASPAVRDSWKDPGDRALYVLIKERKFGAGCVDDWRHQRPALLARASSLLAPTERTLAAQPFIFGAAPTLADAALYGQLAMLHAADPALLTCLSSAFLNWAGRVEESTPQPMAVRLAR